MALAIRSALSKLTNTSSRKNTSGILMLRAFASSAIETHPNHQDRKDDAVWSFSGGRFDYKSHEIKKEEPKLFKYHAHLGGLEPARFAMEEFNKRKNAQLQFARLVKAHRHLCTRFTCLYVITLEAIDAGVAKLYQAKVSVNFTHGMFLEWFCRVVDDGCPLALFDHLENFFALKDHEDKTENQIPMCKKQGLNCSNNSCIKVCGILPAYDVENNGQMQGFGLCAVKMFNEEKSAELEFVRVMSGSWLKWGDFFYLTLEAAEAGMMKTYQAELFLPVNERMYRLNLFGHFLDNGRLSILIDRRHECTKETLVCEARQQGYCRYKDVDDFLPPFIKS